jgi:formylglycine-generating enzyme required for sulfatase activity
MDVVKKLADERLLVTNRAVAGEETVEVSHEALIRQWQRLQGWLNEDREFLLWRERLRGRVNDWQQNKHDDGTLLRGALLVEAQRWLSQKADILTNEEKDYLRHSAEARERTVQAEQQRAEHELAQARRLAEEAAKREEAERARAAAAEQAQQAAEEAWQAQQARAQEAERAREAEAKRAEVAERARRRQRYFSLALLILFLGGWIVTWLWQKGYDLDQAGLKVKSLFVGISEEPKMVRIPDGTFQQGDVEGLGEPWRNPVRPVRIKPFAMGRYEVTFEEYDRFAIATGRDLPNDQKWGRGRRPVINVSWEDVKAYAEWLSKQTGKRYRLPTESEWEYAARSGAKQQVWAGTSEESDLKKYAVFFSNSRNQAAPVGQKDPNGFGLHDMSGNVWEWVEDCAHGSYRGAATDGSAWLDADDGDCSSRVIRGGSWDDIAVGLRTSKRFWDFADSRNSLLGFRLAQDIRE